MEKFLKVKSKVSITTLMLVICFLYTVFVHITLWNELGNKVSYPDIKLSQGESKDGYVLMKKEDYEKLIDLVSALTLKTEMLLLRMRVHAQMVLETKTSILESQKSFKIYNSSRNLNHSKTNVGGSK